MENQENKEIKGGQPNNTAAIKAKVFGIYSMGINWYLAFDKITEPIEIDEKAARLLIQKWDMEYSDTVHGWWNLPD